jgi:hypothetical protein
MDFIFVMAERQEWCGWLPNGNRNLSTITSPNMVVHDLVDHGIVANKDYSEDGEALAIGSYCWLNDLHISRYTTNRRSSHYKKLVMEGYTLSQDLFPNKIKIPSGSQDRLEKIASSAYAEWKLHGYSMTKRFDFKAQIVDNELNIINEGGTGVKIIPYRLF